MDKQRLNKWTGIVLVVGLVLGIAFIYGEYRYQRGYEHGEQYAAYRFRSDQLRDEWEKKHGSISTWSKELRAEYEREIDFIWRDAHGEFIVEGFPGFKVNK